MKPPVLLLDVSYLAFRSFFAVGRLSHDSIPTGVVYGVLRETLQLQEQFSTTKVVFCFDHGEPFRKLDCPGYKSSRHAKKSPADVEDLLLVREQVKRLRKAYLGTIGFRNLFWQKGYEADDVIAKVILDRPKRDFIIVSSDHDLYQLLSSRVRIWNPAAKKLITADSFFEEFGVTPSQWADVKAIAGCATDDVVGIRGVGEKTAAKFLCGTLTKGAAFEKIVHGNDTWQRNLGLVSLPYPGIESFQLTKDEITPQGWETIINKLGMKSLRSSLPGLPKREGFSRATFFGRGKNNGKRRGL